MKLPQQMVVPFTLGDRGSFDTFLVGRNGQLIDSVRSCITTCEPSLIYYYGPASSGRSHLLFACMQMAREHKINTSYLPLADSYIAPPMLEMVDVNNLVCIDDVQYWVGDKQQEESLFGLYERIKHAGGQMIVAAAQAPEQQGFVIKDLLSRLSSSLIYPLHKLDEVELKAALKLRAKTRGFKISDEVLNYLVTRVSREINELFQILDEIDQASLIEKRRVTIPFLQTVLGLRG